MPNYIRIINRALWPKTEDLVEGFDVNKIEAKKITKEFRNKDDKKLREYTKIDIREILNVAVRKGKVDYSLLDEKLKNEINKLRESALK